MAKKNLTPKDGSLNNDINKTQNTPPDEIHSFIKDYITNSGKTYTKEIGDEILEKYDYNYDRLIEDSGDAIGLPVEKLPEYKKRVWEGYKIKKPSPEFYAERDFLKTPVELNTEGSYEKYNELKEKRQLADAYANKYRDAIPKDEEGIVPSMDEFNKMNDPNYQETPEGMKDYLNIVKSGDLEKIGKYEDKVREYDEALKQQADYNVQNLNYVDEGHEAFVGMLDDNIVLLKEAKQKMAEKAVVYEFGIKFRAEDQQRVTDLQNIVEIYEDMSKLMSAPQADDKKMKALWYGLSENFFTIDFITLGLNEMGRLFNVKDAFDTRQKLVDEGKSEEEIAQIMPNEQLKLLDAYQMLLTLQSSSDPNEWYSYGEGLKEMIPFIAQFAMTGGVGAGANKAVSTFVKKLTKSQVAGRIAGSVTQSMLRGAASQPMVLQNFANELAPTLDGQGNLTEADIKGWQAYGKSVLLAGAEYFGEGVGEFANKLANKAARQAYANILRSDPNGAKKLLGKIALAVTSEVNVPTIQGIAFEGIGEEATGFLQALIEKDMDSFLSSDTQKQIWVMSVIASGSFMTMSVPGRVNARRKYNSSKNQLNDITNSDYSVAVQSLSENYVNPEEAIEAFNEVNSQFGANISQEDKKKALKFLNNALVLNNMNASRAIQVQEKISQSVGQDGNITITQYKDKPYTVRNPQDLGKEGEIIYLKDQEGKVTPVISSKIGETDTKTQEEVTDASIQAQDAQDTAIEEQERLEQETLQLAQEKGLEEGKTVETPQGKKTLVSVNPDGTSTVVNEKGEESVVRTDEIEVYKTQEQKQAEKEQQKQAELEEKQLQEETNKALLEGIEEGAEVVSDKLLDDTAPEGEQVRIIDFSNGQSKMIAPEGEEIFNTKEDRDYAIKALISGEIQTEEQTIDDLSPEEAYNELRQTDPDAANEMLALDIEGLRVQAEELRTQAKETKSRQERFDLIKQAKVSEVEAARLEEILNNPETLEVVDEPLTDEQGPEDVERTPEVIYAEYIAELENSPEKALQPWQEDLLAQKVSRKSFIEWGDKNFITRGIARAWFEKQDRVASLSHIDTIAQDLTDTHGVEVTPSDIVDFIVQHPNGTVRKTTDTQIELQREYKELTGKPISKHEAPKTETDMSDVPFRVEGVNATNRAGKDLSHKRNAHKAIEKLADDLGVGVVVVHSSEIPREVSKEDMLYNDKGEVIAFGHKGAIFITSDKINSVSGAKKAVTLQAIKNQGVDAVAEKLGINPNKFVKGIRRALGFSTKQFNETDLNTTEQTFDAVRFFSEIDAPGAAEVVVVNSGEELPESVTEHEIYDWDTFSAVFAEGKIFVNNNGVRSRDEAVAIWVHENGLHKGIRTLIPDATQRNILFERVVDSVMQMSEMSYELSEAIQQVVKVYGNRPTAEQGEEIMAYFAEKIIKGEQLTPAEKSIWTKITDLVRSILNKIYKFDTQLLTEEDIANIVYASVKSTFNEQGDSNQGTSAEVRQRQQPTTPDFTGSQRRDVQRQELQDTLADEISLNQEQDAETIREDEGQIPEGRDVGEASTEESSEDIQLKEEAGAEASNKKRVRSIIDRISKGPKFRVGSKLTLNIFNRDNFKELEGKNVNPAHIQQLLNQQGIKAIEKDIVNAALNTFEYEGKRLDYDKFKSHVESNIVGLKRLYTNTYADYGMNALGDGNYGDANTVIFNAPVEHGVTGHFPRDFVTTNERPTTYELKQIPDKDIWVAMDVDTPPGLPESELQNYVGTAGPKESVEAWIASHEGVKTSGEDVNKGMFGHARIWDDGDSRYIVEAQSDFYQKENAKKRIGDKILENPERWSDKLKSLMDDLRDAAIANVESQIESLKVRKFTLEKEEGEDGKIIAKVISTDSDGNRGSYMSTTDILRAETTLKGVIEDNKNNIKDKQNDIWFYKNINEYDGTTQSRILKEAGEKAAKPIQNKIYKELENLYTPEEKQFIASQKVFEKRLIQEAVKDAALDGMEVIRIPTPHTIATIEGFIEGGEGGLPYDITEADDHDTLEEGDLIDYGGQEMVVLDSYSDHFEAAPTGYMQEFSWDEYESDERQFRWDEDLYEVGNSVDDINAITREEAEELDPANFGGMGYDLAQKIKDEFDSDEELETVDAESFESDVKDDYDISEGMGIEDHFSEYGYYNVKVNGDRVTYFTKEPHIEVFSQPSEIEGVEKDDFVIEDLNDDHQVVVNKYVDLNNYISKIRDTRTVEDHNGFEWIESDITNDDRDDAIVAFRVEDAKFKIEPSEPTKDSKLFTPVALDDLQSKLEKHKDTPWANAVKKSVSIQNDISNVIDGKKPEVLKGKLAQMLQKDGEQGLWNYFEKFGVIGSAAKSVNNISTSLLNCDPSQDCAQFCYACKGNYSYASPSIKSEAIEWALNKDPVKLGEIAARQYKATQSYMLNKALRLEDKGDINENTIPFVEELNRQGVRTHIFSKKPEVLSQIPSDNIRLLSIDESNMDKAEGNDLQIAYTYKGTEEDLKFIEANKDRIQVILPVKSGKKTLDKKLVDKLPKSTKQNQCPIDSGAKDLKQWNCTSCDAGKGIGCYNNQTTPSTGIEVDKDYNYITEKIRNEINNLPDEYRTILLEELRDVENQEPTGNESTETGEVGRTNKQLEELTGQHNENEVGFNESPEIPTLDKAEDKDVKFRTKEIHNLVKQLAEEQGRVYDPKVVDSFYDKAAKNPRMGWNPKIAARTILDQLPYDDTKFRVETFYSPTEKALQSINQDKGTVSQFEQMLLKNGAKQAELDWMGFRERFPSVNSKVTKEDIQGWIDENKVEIEEVEKGGSDLEERIDALLEDELGQDMSREEAREFIESDSEEETTTKYSTYQLPGGKNYKELLLTMPGGEKVYNVENYESFPQEVTDIFDKYEDDEAAIVDALEEIGYEVLDRQPDFSFTKFVKTTDNNKNDYRTSHFDEANILAHTRFNERTDSEGNKVLFLEELQSDWAQEGRKKGFDEQLQNEPKITIDRVSKGENDYTVFFSNGQQNRVGQGVIGSNADDSEVKDYFKNILAEMNEEVNRENRNTIPNMPFKKTDQWINLALRRMIRYAAENGFDKVAWTTGEQQASRYDLSKQVDNIDVNPIKEKSGGTRSVFIQLKDNTDHLLYINDEGKIVDSGKGEYVGQNISDVIGKEISDRILSVNEETTLSGDNLKVGGEGMKSFYDKMLPKAANKLGKKFGSKVEVIKIHPSGLELNELTNKVNTKEGYRPLEEDMVEQLSLPITDKMKESVMNEGQPMFRVNTRKVKTDFMNGNIDVDRDIDYILEQEYGAKKVLESDFDTDNAIYSDGFIHAIEQGKIPTLELHPTDSYRDYNELEEYHHVIINGEAYNVYFKEPNDVKFKVEEEREKVETNPSEAQIDAGNYKKGHIRIDGFDISIENPKGGIRKGTDEKGEEWSAVLPGDYGYFRGTVGKDKDHIDVFLGDNLESDKVYVIDQINPNTGAFDEHKVIMGTNSLAEAKNLYMEAYEEGWQGLGAISRTTKEGLKEWMKGDTKKPYSAEEVKFQVKSDNPEVQAMLDKLREVRELSKTAAKVRGLEQEVEEVFPELRQIVVDQLNAFKAGAEAGAEDTQTMITEVQKAITDYAKKTLPLTDAGAREIGPVLTLIKNAQTPEDIENAFNRIDELAGRTTERQERKKYTSKVNRLLKFMTGLKKQGTRKVGKFVYEDTKAFQELKEIDKRVSDLTKIVNSNKRTEEEKLEAESKLNQEWETLNEKTEKTALDNAMMKLIELRRLGSKASPELAKATAEELEAIYAQAKEAKSEEDVEKAISRGEDKEFVKKFVRGHNIDDKNFFNRVVTKMNNVTANVMGNWETLMTMLGGNKAKDKLSLIIDQVNEEMGIQDSFNKVLDKAKDVYGLKNRDAVLKHIQKLKEENYKLRQPNAVKEGSPIKVTKMMLLDIYNAIKNKDIANSYFMSFGDITLNADGSRDEDAQRKSGEKRINDLLDNLDDADKAFGDSMMEVVQTYKESTNEVYVKMFNKDMDFVENYWPSTASYESDVDVMEKYFNEGKMPTSTQIRSADRTPEPRDAFDKFSKHVKEAEWYKNMAIPLDNINKTFKDLTVKKLITDARGNRYYNTIQTHFKNLGLGASTRNLTDFEKGGGKILGNWVAAKIGMTPSVPFKQLTSMINYAENMPVGRWGTGFTKGIAEDLAKFTTTGKAPNFEWMWENVPYLKDRFKGGYSEALQYAMNATTGIPKATNAQQKIKNIATIGTRGGDITAIVYGGKPYIDYLMKKKGMSKEEAVNKFMLDTLRSQQSPFSSTLSTFQNSKNPLAKALFTFANTPSQYMRKMFEASQAYRHGDISAAQLAKIYAIYGIANQFLYVGAGALMSALLKGADPEEDLLENTVVQSLTSLVAGIPAVRDIVNSTLKRSSGLHVFDDSLPVLSELDEISESIYDATQGKKPKENYGKAFMLIMELAGIPANNAKKLWDATVNREEVIKKTVKYESRDKLNDLIDSGNPFEVRMAKEIKISYSKAKSKATRLRKEGNNAQADRIERYIDESKLRLRDQKYSKLGVELRKFKSRMEALD